MAASFGSVNHDWLIRFLKQRIGDKRIIRLIRKWLRAGTLDDGVVTVADSGTGQGSVISPLLGNIYLHYVFDLWAERWRRREARGDMIVVGYADDLVAGFEHEGDARRFLDAMRERFEAFLLTVHPDKTRLIEFGLHAAANRIEQELAPVEEPPVVIGELSEKKSAGRSALRWLSSSAGSTPKTPPKSAALAPHIRRIEKTVDPEDCQRWCYTARSPTS